MKKLFFLMMLSVFAACTNSNKDIEKETGIEIQWNFSRPQTIDYTYKQRTSSNTRFMIGEEPSKDSIVANGLLSIKVKTNQLADLVLSDVVMVRYNLDNQNEITDSMSINMPTTVTQDFGEKGNSDHSVQNMQIDLLFPMIDLPLSIGKTQELTKKFPVTFSGSRLFAHGSERLTLIEVSANNIAQIKSEISIDQLDIPEEMEGQYSFMLVSDAKYFFNLKKGYYEEAEVNVKITMATVSSGKENQDDEVTTFMPGGMDMTMENTSSFTIKKLE